MHSRGIVAYYGLDLVVLIPQSFGLVDLYNTPPHDYDICGLCTSNIESGYHAKNGNNGNLFNI